MATPCHMTCMQFLTSSRHLHFCQPLLQHTRCCCSQANLTKQAAVSRALAGPGGPSAHAASSASRQGHVPQQQQQKQLQQLQDGKQLSLLTLCQQNSSYPWHAGRHQLASNRLVQQLLQPSPALSWWPASCCSSSSRSNSSISRSNSRGIASSNTSSSSRVWCSPAAASWLHPAAARQSGLPGWPTAVGSAQAWQHPQPGNATPSRIPQVVQSSAGIWGVSNPSNSSISSSSSSVRGFSTASQSTSSTTASSTSSEPPKNLKGALPGSGPSHKTLRALPFTVSRTAAAEAFAAYHGRHWYQSRQRPLLAKAFKETFLPFWVGSGVVRVEVQGAEVGHEHLVTRYDKARNRAEPRWETVWSRVKLHLVWDRQLQPEEPEAQLYASWKYPRSDVEVLRPGPIITLARAITPDMLQASAGAGTDTRRVGPFTVDPKAARRLLMSHIESTERKRAEAEIARLTGAQQVRFVDMHCTYMGSSGAASSKAAAAEGSGGLDLSPVYVPAYIFSWWHGGAKVRTFVSGVNASAVSGVQVLDNTKMATYATLATAGVGLFLGLPFNTLLWGGLVVPFVTVGLVSRFWPRVRSTFVGWKERLQRRWKQTVSDQEYCEVDWNAEFVHAYEAGETRRRQQEQRQSYWQDHGQGPFGGQDPQEFFQQFMRDPFSWFEKHFAKQQQQQQQQQGYQQQFRQQQQQQQYGGGSRTSSTAGSTGSRGDPLGYYNTLGIKPGCSTQEVQAAFRGLALKHHPDRYSSPTDKSAATKKFQTITEAYQVLRDPKKRQLYDAGQYHDRA